MLVHTKLSMEIGIGWQSAYVKCGQLKGNSASASSHLYLVLGTLVFKDVEKSRISL